jgi:predicted AAA+ superfamily ATPase
MIARHLQATIERRLQQYPAVALLGPRQVGKTTLARAVAASHPGTIVLDLERESDRAVLARPELFLPLYRDRLVVLDTQLTVHEDGTRSSWTVPYTAV